MAQQCEADKVIQLLQFCSWKAQTELANNGLLDLNAKLSDENIPNEKYLVDLYSDAKIAIKKDNILSKRKSHIDLILRFAGFDSWSIWKEHLFNGIEYVSLDTLSSFPSQKLKLAFWNPQLLEKSLIKTLQFVCETGFLKPSIIRCSESSLEESVEHLTNQLQEDVFIIALFPIEWKQIPNDQKTEWDLLVKSHKVVPVWIDSHNVWETTAPFIPGLKPNKVISGIAGALTTLLFFEKAILGHNIESLSADDTKNTPSGSSQHFHNPSGGIYMQGDIHNLHNGNGNQIINNYLD